ncbi:hypothetical protein BN1708_003412 [Verticillium longisporum]|uniref:Uncharacterized protein n=1 Tax=Verticillium longisporum TaxID=100787 RepID=A0A0G4LGB7_VERLO|nr:hypothetical protein BN1708_003412 [Verticillium longisporum]
MARVGVLARLDLKWHRQNTSVIAVFHGDLDSGVDVALETIHRRPDMLLDVEQLAHAHVDLLPVTV